MAYEPVIENAERINGKLTLNGTVKRGNTLAYNGTGWVQADASDATVNLYAQYIAMESGESSTVIPGCKSCVLYDEDAPYTANATQYVSATAGAITATRPSTDGDVIQVVGRATSTKRAKIDIESPKEVEVFLPCPNFNALNGGAVEAHAADGTTNEWAGADADSAAVCAVFTGWFPSGLVGAVLAANLVVNTQASTALDIDVTYVRAYIDGANTGDVGTSKTALTTSSTTADNEVQWVDISAGMDAGFTKPGAPFGVAIDPDAGDFLVLGLYMRYLVV